jgi:hypothetical protein
MFDHIFHVVTLGGAPQCWTLLDGTGAASAATWDSQRGAIEAAKQRAIDVGWAHIDVFDRTGALEREFLYGADLVERPPWPGAMGARADGWRRSPS